MYVAGVAGVGLVVLQISSSSPAVVYWKEPPTSLTALKVESNRAKGKENASSTEGGGVVGFANRQGDEGRRSFVAVRDSRGDWRRRLVTSSGGGEDQQEVLEELTQEEEEATAEAATAEACADNSFSGGGAGKVVLLVIAILFTFNGLAIVCDEFFQASLEKISEVSRMPACKLYCVCACTSMYIW